MKKKNYTVAVLPGDGIGPEVINETYKILDVINNYFKIKILTKEYDIGGIAIDKTGSALPPTTIDGCKKSNAILLGSIGGPKWKNLPNEKQPERGGLLPLRKKFDLFCNLRPAKLYENLSHLSPLRNNIIFSGFDILCVRELTGGIYFGQPKGRAKKNKKIYAFDTEIYFKNEIERIAILAFKIARKRKHKITSVDKANVLESSVLWRETVTKIAQNYPDVILEHLYIDNAVMQIIKNPNQFDVILCSNLFGDILSDECGMITGSIGLLPSASINEKNFGIYEPAGGSAPDIQGQNIANPIAQILSLSMLIKYSINQNLISKAIDTAVKNVLHAGYRTFDLTNNKTNYLTTSKMGSKIADFLIKGIQCE